MFLDEGFQAFVPKPINTAKLDAAIKQWIIGHGEENTPEDTNVNAADDGEINIDIPGINTTLALSLYEDDAETLIVILRSYAENVSTELERMKTLTEETLPDYAIDIHTMKGASASIGAKDLTRRAKNMERMAKNGDFAAVSELNESYIKDAETLVSDIRKWLEEN
jgi:HPt (histidine-containing phosphotransfer) domain-containing protein